MVIETSEATPERDRSPKCVHIDFSLEVDAWMHIADGDVNIAVGVHFRIIYFWTPPSGRRRWYTGSWCLTARRTCCASEQPSWSWRGTLCTRPCRFTLPPVSAHLEHWFLRKDINSALYFYICILQKHFKGEHLQALLGICRSEDWICRRVCWIHRSLGHWKAVVDALIPADSCKQLKLSHSPPKLFKLHEVYFFNWKYILLFKNIPSIHCSAIIDGLHNT